MFDESLITYDDKTINHTFIDPWETYIPQNTNMQDNAPDIPSGDNFHTKEDSDTVRHSSQNRDMNHNQTNSNLSSMIQVSPVEVRSVEVRSEEARPEEVTTPVQVATARPHPCVFVKNENTNLVDKVPEEINSIPAHTVCTSTVECKSANSESEPEKVTRVEHDDTKAGDRSDNVSSIIQNQCSQFMCRFVC